MDREEQPLIGESGAFLAVLERVSHAAALDRPLLIVGERGTGKELIAERVHFLSPRWDQPLVKLNCAAISPSLLESELFGHEAGAFTDASRTRIGRFEQADGGTLVLDELATAAQPVQEKILRVIEYGEFERLGSSQTRRIDVRVVGATNEDLPSLAAAGRFRADLLDRLSFDVITLPPLRERAEDLMPLAEHFAIRMSRELGRDLFAGFSARAVEQLRRWRWPGNVRELKNVVERAVYRLEDAERRVDRLEFDPFDSPWRPRSGTASMRSGPTGTAEREGDAGPDRELPSAGSTSSGAEHRPTERPIDVPDDLKGWLAEQEQAWIERALAECGHHQKRTAERLGLTYDQLRAALRKYGISR